MVPQEAFEFLVLAWHYEHLVYQAQAKHKRAQQREQAFWLACAAGLVGDEFDTSGVDVQGSTLLAGLLLAGRDGQFAHSAYLNSCKGQITQETLNLIMFTRIIGATRAENAKGPH